VGCRDLSRGRDGNVAPLIAGQCITPRPGLCCLSKRKIRAAPANAREAVYRQGDSSAAAIAVMKATHHRLGNDAATLRSLHGTRLRRIVVQPSSREVGASAPAFLGGSSSDAQTPLLTREIRPNSPAKLTDTQLDLCPFSGGRSSGRSGKVGDFSGHDPRLRRNENAAMLSASDGARRAKKHGCRHWRCGVCRAAIARAPSSGQCTDTAMLVLTMAGASKGLPLRRQKRERPTRTRAAEDAGAASGGW
jgi:hypothetical protein